jgi:uncharacterized protein (DUF362 family)/Pyruvate/2-oxoacid:ferredoxin oxidoreductase delta subunit
MNDYIQPVVAVVPCPSYELATVEEAVNQAVAWLGGWERFVSEGQRWLVKPNMLSDRAPEEGVTTHPAVMEAVVKRLKDYRIRVKIGDSPSNAHHGVQRHWIITGFTEVTKKYQVELVSFEGQTAVWKKIGESTYFVAKPVVECDGILNLPKLKTHNLTILTGAVKNMFGILPGFQKADLHRKHPKPLGFSKAVVDVFGLAPPKLTIMDAVIVMEGNGPSEGELRKVGVIIASDDAVALDVVAGMMMGLTPRKVHTTRIAGERGLGCAEVGRIELKGMEWDKLPITGFKLPATHIVNRIPEGLSKLLAGLVWIQPRVEVGTCTKCRKCIEACPVSCISINQTAAIIDSKRCIQCYCCTEVCPEGAVVLDRSLMARMVMK